MTRATMIERVAVLETKLDSLSSKLDQVLSHQEQSASERSEIKSLLADMDKRLKVVEPLAQNVQRWRERAIVVSLVVILAIQSLGFDELLASGIGQVIRLLKLSF